MSQDATDESVRSLAELGFTELEAAVYAYLVEHAPATAYGVAQGIGRQVANTYKAVESLRKKGAVLVDETRNRSCRAVPPAELLGRLRETFEQRHHTAAEALSRLQPTSTTEGIYALTAPAEVYERVASLLERAREVVLLDAFPGVLEALRPGLESAAAGGVQVVVQAYGQTEVRGAELVIHAARQQVMERWPGQWMCVVVDGAEYLFAYLDSQGSVVHQAVWSASPFLAWLQHSYIAQSLRATLLEGLLAEGADADSLAAAMARSARWLAPDAPGYRELQDRLRGAEPEEQGSRRGW